MLAKFKNSIKYYQFKIFSNIKKIKHGVFTKDLKQELNFNLAFADSYDDSVVLKNIRMAESLIDVEPSFFVKQNHGVNIYWANENDKAITCSTDVPYGYDAIVTNTAKKTILIKMADCQGIMLYDPISSYLALIHSGWRGSVQNIIGQTILALKTKGIQPEHLLAAISPSIGPCCAEFKNYKNEIPKKYWQYKNEINDNFNFWEISRQQLLEQGVLPNNIEISGICTKCDPDFFSYRGGDKYGRFAIIASLI